MSDDKNWLTRPGEKNDIIADIEDLIADGNNPSFKDWPRNHPPDTPKGGWRPSASEYNPKHRSRLIDLSSAVDRQISGGHSMASVSEILGAIDHAKGGVVTEVAASLRGTIASCEDVEMSLHSLMGESHPPSVINALAGLAQIREWAGQSLAAAQGVIENLDTYAGSVQTG
jgi:hypothetical protein